MRFILGIFLLMIIALLGLLVYGQMLEPDVKRIETEVETNENDA